MKLFLVTLFIGIAAAGKLQNSYIPPSSAGSAGGGHGGFLQGPHQSNPSSQYLPPQQNFNNFGQPSSFSHGTYQQPQHSQQSYQPQHHGSSGPPIPILKYENVNNGDGSYHFDYATGNGIMQNEQGHLNNPGTDHAEQVVQGSYSYTGDDGKVYTVHYKADSNGFQATGDHLPTPPPIPEAIQKSLAAGGHGHGGGGGGGGGYGGQYQQPQGGYSQGRPQQQYLPPQQSNSGYHY